MKRLQDYKQIYIAGPITGMPKGNKEAFSDMEGQLLSMGCYCYNPRAEPLPPGIKQCDINPVMMRIALKNLMLSDAIVMLKGWGWSDGATLEYNIAKYLRLPIYDYNLKRVDVWNL